MTVLRFLLLPLPPTRALSHTRLPYSARRPLQVVYEGMYGTPDLQAAACAAERLLLFAGGSGVTPLASVLTALLRQEKERDEAVAAAGGGGGLGVAGMGGGGAEAPSGAGWSVAEGVLQAATGLPRAPPRVELVWAVQHQVGEGGRRVKRVGRWEGCGWVRAKGVAETGTGQGLGLG